MSPKLTTVEVVVGTDSDERTGVGTGGGPGTGEGRELAAGGRGDVARRELPPGEAAVAIVSPGRRESAPAPAGRPEVQSRDAGEDAAAGAGPDSAEIERRRDHALRADAHCGASRERGRPHDRSRNAAPLDAGGGAVEPPAHAVAVSPPPRAEGAFRRAGAAGRQFSSLV